jgi:hypothetical protein
LRGVKEADMMKENERNAETRESQRLYNVQLWSYLLEIAHNIRQVSLERGERANGWCLRREMAMERTGQIEI